MSQSTGMSDSGYSPPISITLTLQGEHYNVASLDSGRVRLRDARPAEPGQGVIRLEVDGRITLFHVDLTEGIDPARQYQSYHRVAVAEGAAA